QPLGTPNSASAPSSSWMRPFAQGRPLRKNEYEMSGGISPATLVAGHKRARAHASVAQCRTRSPPVYLTAKHDPYIEDMRTPRQPLVRKPRRVPLRQYQRRPAVDIGVLQHRIRQIPMRIHLHPMRLDNRPRVNGFERFAIIPQPRFQPP